MKKTMILTRKPMKKMTMTARPKMTMKMRPKAIGNGGLDRSRKAR